MRGFALALLVTLATPPIAIAQRPGRMPTDPAADRAFFAGRYDEALRLHRAREAECIKQRGNDEYCIDLMLVVTNVLVRQGDYAAAEKQARRVLAFAEGALGPQATDVASALTNLGMVLMQMDRLEEAEPLLRRAVAIDDATLDLYSPERAIGLNNLAGLLQAQRRHAEAEPLYRHIVEILEFFSKDEQLVRALNNLAANQLGQDRTDEALALYRRALTLQIRIAGIDHPRSAELRANYAVALSAAGRSDEAERGYREALATYDRLDMGQSQSALPLLLNLSDMLIGQGRVEEATALLERARTAYTAHRPGGRLRVRGEILLGRSLMRLGHYAQARATLRRTTSEIVERSREGQASGEVSRASLRDGSSAFHALLETNWVLANDTAH